VLTGDAFEPDQFWATVERHLRAGRIRMVFVVDDVPPELLRIVEFLGRQLRDAEVYLVEVRQHVGQSGRILASTVIGTPPSSTTTGTNRAPRISEDQWIAAFESRQGQQQGAIAREFVAPACGSTCRSGRVGHHCPSTRPPALNTGVDVQRWAHKPARCLIKRDSKWPSGWLVRRILASM
jgi:hypothetical protein